MILDSDSGPVGDELVDALKKLADAVAGPVLLPGDPGYDGEVAGYNAAVRQAPVAVVGVTSVADVSEAVRFAADRGLPVAVRSTGHGPMRPADGALLISMRRIGGVEIDAAARTARIGAGVRWSTVVEAAAAHGLAPLSGATPSVGVIGYLTGGGIGHLARAYGFAADHVRSLEIVTPDGVVRTADPQENTDLFWAVRGGKGNFGVVTSVVIDLFPVATLYGGGIYFPGEAAPAVLAAYRGMHRSGSPSCPLRLWTRSWVWPAPAPTPRSRGLRSATSVARWPASPATPTLSAAATPASWSTCSRSSRRRRPSRPRPRTPHCCRRWRLGPGRPCSTSPRATTPRSSRPPSARRPTPACSS